MKLFAKLNKSSNGWASDKERSENLLKTIDEDTLLEVESIAINSCSSSVALVDHGEGWNSVQFTFYVDKDGYLEEYSFLEDKYDLPQIYSNYIIW